MKKCFHFGRAIYSNIQSDNGSAIFSWHILWWTSDKVSLFYWHRKGRVGQLQRRAKALLRLAGSTIEYPMGLKDSWSSWVKINYPAHLKLSVLPCSKLSLFYRWDSWGSERPKWFFKNTNLICSRHRTWTYIFPVHHVTSGMRPTHSPSMFHPTLLISSS